MKAIIFFHESTDVKPNTADIDNPPRAGDFFDLPDIDNQEIFPVERVIWRLERPRGMENHFCLPASEDTPQVQIYLGLGQRR